MKHLAMGLMAMTLFACQAPKNSDVLQIVSTEQEPWKEVAVQASAAGTQPLDLKIDLNRKGQQMDGFGACFNELGWTSLSLLPEADRTAIMEELFKPGKGANFSICRMPVGANDFSRQWYSYNEVDADFEMYNFSINNDYATLIPFIKSALSNNPELRIWASPWCPPTWMKHNRHYASAYNGNNNNIAYRNGLPKERVGYEGTDMFILEPEYLQAYALYFKKFIQAYREAGISIFGVMPQNEFNSAQVFPSCCWTAKGLATFIGKYLGPAMQEENVEVLMGTMERANYLLVDSIMKDPDAGKYIKGVGFQWAGQGAIADIHRLYPDLKLYQSEQECGDGKNNWDGLLHSWGLLKHFIKNGASVYDYWNISLKKGGISRWGWAQNSLVVVDEDTHQYVYTIEYYLMKHISHFVQKGAYLLQTDGSATDNTLTFVNPDNSVIVLTVETEGKNQQLTVHHNGKQQTFAIGANTINTLQLK